MTAIHDSFKRTVLAVQHNPIDVIVIPCKKSHTMNFKYVLAGDENNFIRPVDKYVLATWRDKNGSYLVHQLTSVIYFDDKCLI